MRRVFNSRERVALFLRAGGRCEECGVVLGPGWHADHWQPYVAGGATDVINGRALCARCNLRKGANGGTMQHLRKWQQEAVQAYQRANQENFLINATPGAGKTTGALAIAAPYIQARSGARLVVVVPSIHLRTQWRDAAAAAGIQLSAGFENKSGVEARDYQGVILTYQQVASEPTLHRRNCATPTFVILDEPHHAGHDKSWGDALREAFGEAQRRLLITGTAFRSDNAPIPFVRYEENKSVADFTYTYENALTDDVCRSIFFPSFEGNMTWWTAREGERRATFADPLSEADRARRLRTALSPDGEWLPHVLQQADQRLTDMREVQYPRAAGLVIATDQRHARAIVLVLARLTGEAPALAISDEPESSEAIKAFSAGNKKWLVSVKMVSEGVDIPRLCVGVYATVVQTELYFRQVVGRFVRVIPGVEDLQGYLYIAKDDTLIEYVQRIKEERDHVLMEDTEDPDGGTQPSQDDGDDDPPPADPSLFTPVSSQARPDAIFYDHDPYIQAELNEAREFMLGAGFGKRIDEVLAVRFMRLVRAKSGGAPPPPPPEPSPTIVLEKQKFVLRKQLRPLVAQLRVATGLEFQAANYLLKVAIGKGIDQRTLAELELSKTYLREWIALAKSEQAPNGYEGWLLIAQRYSRHAA